MYDPQTQSSGTDNFYYRTMPTQLERRYTEPISQESIDNAVPSDFELGSSVGRNQLRVKLVWKKEKQTLEREVVYFDESDMSVILKWNTLHCHFDGRCILTVGEHTGTLAIADCEEGIYEIIPFNVENQLSASIIEHTIILKLKCDPSDKYCVTETPLQQSLSMLSNPDVSVLPSSFQDISNVSKNLHSDDQSNIVFKLEHEVVTLKNRINSTDDYCKGLERDNKLLIDETTKLKEDKAKLKKESYELDNQLMETMMKLSSKEKLDALTEERFQALLKEAKTLEEANFQLQENIFQQNGESKSNTEMIRNLESERKEQNQNISSLVQERDDVTNKYNNLLEKNEINEKVEEDINRYRSDITLLRESNKAHETNCHILRKQYVELRENVIPSLESDVNLLKDEKAETEVLYKREMENLTDENKNLTDRAKTLQKFFASSNTIKNFDEEGDFSQEPIMIIDTLSNDFESCSNNLKVLSKLLGDSLKSKDLQLEKKQKDLRIARERNDSLMKEVADLGNKVGLLSDNLNINIDEKELLFESIRDFKLEKINLTSLLSLLPEESVKNRNLNLNIQDFSAPAKSGITKVNKYTFDL